VADYFLIKEIGRGSFATVYQARKKDQEQFYAIKAISKASVPQDKFETIQ
jgi:serine/threonine protein kinase